MNASCPPTDVLKGYFLKLASFLSLIIMPFLTIGQEASASSFSVYDGTWNLVEYTGEPEARHETTFSECEGKFYLIGGRESQNIDCFDPETNSWSKMKATSPLIHHFQPVNWNGKIYMLSAMTGQYPQEPPMTHIQIYDPSTDTWSEGSEIPEKRRRGSAGTVVYKDKLYMACGIKLGHTSGTNSMFDEYDPATDTWKVLPGAPHIRDHFYAVLYDDKMYLMGGRNTSYHEPNNFAAFFDKTVREIDVYDFEEESWSTLETKLPMGSAAGGVTVIDDKIMYFGGEIGNQELALNRCWLFDPEAETWEEVAPLHVGRHGTMAITYEGKVYTAAGSPKRGGGKTNTMEVYEF